jgi:transposase
VIPRKSKQQDGRARFEKAVYRNRNIIERLVGWMKESRRIGTRYEKLAINFLGMVRKVPAILGHRQGKFKITYMAFRVIGMLIPTRSCESEV